MRKELHRRTRTGNITFERFRLNLTRAVDRPRSDTHARYTRLLLHFICGMKAALNQSVEAFVFSTRLTRIMRPLQTRDLDLALRNVSELVNDWAGGTRIGESLKTFNFK